jgi:hypothetical protein
MSLSNDLLTLVNKPSPRHSCLVRTILGNLDDIDREALQATLANRSISNAEISRTLIANNIIAKTGVIGKHRNQDCSCNVLER